MKLDAWEQALSDAMGDCVDVVPSGCITVYEYARQINKSHSQAAKRMRFLIDTGKAEPAGTFRIKSGNRLYPVLHYRLKKK